MTLGAVEHILDVLEQHERHAGRVINMVPAENSMSAFAKLPMMLDVYHRYHFNVASAPDEWNFRGAEDVADLERLTLDLLRELTGAAHVNIRPLSGLHGMTVVLSALAAPGATVMSVSPEQGGHYATASLAVRFGLRVCHLTGPDAHTIDWDAAARTLREQHPALIYIDQSNCLFPLDVGALARLRDAECPEALLHVDCSHWLGLVLGGQLPNPLDCGADSFGGSTHKTFPGPHKAIVATRRQDLRDRVYRAQFEMISSHHLGSTISLGMALLEFKLCGGRRYAAALLQNTRLLGAELHRRGVGVVAAERGFSGGHQLWIRTAPDGIDAYAASDRLYRAGIRVNAFPELPGIAERAIRIGVNEATYHGLQPADMTTLADVFAAAVFDREPGEALAEQVARLRAHYRHVYGIDMRDGPYLSRALELVRQALAPNTALEVDRPALRASGST
jgi:glycine hydroxymethyltransferase